MSEVSLMVLIEAGQTRNLAAVAFRVPLPDVLLWGPDAIDRIESQTQQIDCWPSLKALQCAVVLHRDQRRIAIAGASNTFTTPYQLVLFLKMLRSVWPGYQVDPIAMTEADLAEAVAGSIPEIDPALADQLMNESFGDIDEEDDEDYQEYDDDFDHSATDLRQLVRREQSWEPDEDEEDERLWWVSLKLAEPDDAGNQNTRQPVRHLQGSFVWSLLDSAGPNAVEQLAELPTAEIPTEEETNCGIVLDLPARSISFWSHPSGSVSWQSLQQAWDGWAMEYWVDNGFRRQLEWCGDAGYVPASDTRVLAEFVPELAEQPDFDEIIGDIKSGFRSMVRRGFGCLALALAVPALLAWAVSGSWQGPFAFAAGLWLVVYIGYRLLLGKLKRNLLAGVNRESFKQDTFLPKLAPESKEERIRMIDEALQTARLPSFQQINDYYENVDEDWDEPVEPIVRSSR
ncbi:MAG: hypothetical protein MI861_12795 [Pirellulales bacterium]|nr:hypothetical protein [Pirellulales bacterium]